MRATLGILPLCLLAHLATADEHPQINMSDATKLMHPQPALGVVPLEPAFEDYAFMLFDICETVDIECLIYPMMGEIGNAVAYQNDLQMRIVVYDRNLSRALGYIGAQAVIAHEVGHHYCQHLTERRHLESHKAEAEADRFLGYSMAKAGTRLSELIAAYETLGIDQGSETHPPMAERVIELSSGYYSHSLSDICPGRDPN